MTSIKVIVHTPQAGQHKRLYSNEQPSSSLENIGIDRGSTIGVQNIAENTASEEMSGNRGFENAF
jgi:hypothetical protein